MIPSIRQNTVVRGGSCRIKCTNNLQSCSRLPLSRSRSEISGSNSMLNDGNCRSSCAVRERIITAPPRCWSQTRWHPQKNTKLMIPGDILNACITVAHVIDKGETLLVVVKSPWTSSFAEPGVRIQRRKKGVSTSCSARPRSSNTISAALFRTFRRSVSSKFGMRRCVHTSRGVQCGTSAKTGVVALEGIGDRGSQFSLNRSKQSGWIAVRAESYGTYSPCPQAHLGPGSGDSLTRLFRLARLAPFGVSPQEPDESPSCLA